MERMKVDKEFVIRMRFSNYFFIIKPIRCTNFTNLFWHETISFGQFLCPL